jgi:hypothetical protein
MMVLVENDRRDNDSSSHEGMFNVQASLTNDKEGVKLVTARDGSHFFNSALHTVQSVVKPQMSRILALTVFYYHIQY